MTQQLAVVVAVKSRFLANTCKRAVLFTSNAYWISNELFWWQIGSFGAITRILNIVPKREDLLKVATAGPLAGFSFGLVLLLLGFILPPADGIGVVVDASVFHESFLAGGIGKHFVLSMLCLNRHGLHSIDQQFQFFLCCSHVIFGFCFINLEIQYLLVTWVLL